jgi:hypothetical protein
MPNIVSHLFFTTAIFDGFEKEKKTFFQNKTRMKNKPDDVVTKIIN